MRKRLFYIAPFAILGIALFIVIGGEVVMRLWNWLLPGLFGWPSLTFWQALALLALCRILFGGFGRHGMRSRMGQRMAEKMERMSPEERERLRSIRSRCGFGPTAAETKSE
jgi:hypothetical protein